MSVIPPQADYEAAVATRAGQIVDSLCERDAKGLYAAHAVMLGRDDAAAVSATLTESFGQLGTGPFARNAAGTFDVFAAMTVVCRWGERLDPEAIGHVRRVFADGVQNRGNTENHWLMHYVGNLLAVQRFGAEVDLWWNGLPPQAMAAEARRWLLGIIDRTARFGHHEYDSPQYHPWHVLPMLTLADHAADEEVRRQAAKAATLLVADMALEYHKGSWAGGHAREGYRENTWTRSGQVGGLQYLFFGGEDFDADTHGHPLAAIAAAATWRPPALLASLALEAGTPRTVRKTKAPREIFRHVRQRPQPVRKTTYLSDSFALGSTQVGLPGAPAGPIDLISWDLTWAGPKHQAKIAATHPYTDPGRFSAFLGGPPQRIGRDIAAHKPYLQWPDRLFGATPFERMVQHEGAILVLYRIPTDDANPYVNLYLPKACDWDDAGAGWLCADPGGFHVGVRPIGDWRWEYILEDPWCDGWMLRLDGPCCGFALEAVEAADVDSYGAWVEGRGAAPPELDDWPASGRATFTSTAGHTLELVWPADGVAVRRVDGQVVDDDGMGLYEAPGVDAPLGSGRVRIEHGGQHLELDFDVDPSSAPMPMRVIG